MIITIGDLFDHDAKKNFKEQYPKIFDFEIDLEGNQFAYSLDELRKVQENLEVCKHKSLCLRFKKARKNFLKNNQPTATTAANSNSNSNTTTTTTDNSNTDNSTTTTTDNSTTTTTTDNSNNVNAQNYYNINANNYFYNPNIEQIILNDSKHLESENNLVEEYMKEKVLGLFFEQNKEQKETIHFLVEELKKTNWRQLEMMETINFLDEELNDTKRNTKENNWK